MWVDRTLCQLSDIQRTDGAATECCPRIPLLGHTSQSILIAGGFETRLFQDLEMT